MKTRYIVTIACVASAMVLALFQHVDASGTPGRTAYLTFSQPVSLPGVSLGAGTYTFEVINPNTSADVVRVSSRDGKIAYYMGFTQRVSRPSNLRADAQVSLGESAANSPRPITVWWHNDAADGHQFIYDTK
jgi:hypothetical protein